MSVHPYSSNSNHQQPVSAHFIWRKPLFLIVDDDSHSFASLPHCIKSDTFSPLLVPDEQHAFELLRHYANRIQLILIDQKSSGLGGAGFLHVAKRIVPQVAFLITTPLGPIFSHSNRFYELMRVNLKSDIDTILTAIAEKIDLLNSKTLTNLHSWQRRPSFGEIIGQSQEMNQIYSLIQTISKSTSTVCIQGESGTGKELIARTIHANSPRHDKPFVAINCCSISENLFESELFGHEKGAFTSAFNLHKGKCEIASGGTLFLDEIGELEANIQIKLLRFLQEKEFHRVGGNSIIHSDCRLITATNRNLDQDIVNRRFREDLYYRINVIPIYVPPLRKRRQDIPLLLEHFFKKYSETINRSPAKLTPDALEALQAYHYPGNIRELINIVERLSVICSSQLISFDDLPQEIQRTAKSPSECHTMLKELPEEGVPLQTVERELILKTLEKTSGNKVVASKMLGITRRLLYLRLKEYTQKASADVT
jgi:two-component system NtrC family response regulator